MKKITSLLLAVLLISALSVSVFAEHNIYDKYRHIIGTCTNTCYNVKQIEKPVGALTTHRHSSGAVCTIGVFKYSNIKICSSCGTEVGVYSRQCILEHSVCKSEYKNCLEE